MTTTNLSRQIYHTLQARPRPEEVADLIQQAFVEAYPARRQYLGDQEIGDQVPAVVRQALSQVAMYAHRWRGGWSSMSEDFQEGKDQVRRTSHAVEVLSTLVPDTPLTFDPADYSSVMRAVMEAGASILWTPADTDFKRHRLNRDRRRDHGLDISKRQYNRRFRALNRAREKATKLADEQRKRELILIGRSGFGHRLTWDTWESLTWAERAFIAYLTARRNIRRQFTLSGRDNPYDELCAALMSWIHDHQTHHWGVLAQVYPTPGVLEHLDNEGLGFLMGEWWNVMALSADLMASVWNPDAVDRQTFGVRRNMDSSTWNTMAQAYNAARSGWINVVSAAGAADLFEVALPPKAMRLMAADLMRWHLYSGGTVHPDTVVAAELPLPWEVIRGEVSCTMNDVIVACEKAGVDADASGWTAPRMTGAVATFRPTKELVHGVAISDPGWAQILRKAGVFSGQGSRFRPDQIPEGMPLDVIDQDLPSFPRED